MKALDLPDGIETDPNAKELLRLWAANKKLNVSINVGCFTNNGKDEATAWGIVLSDLTRHVGRALSQQYQANEEQVIAKVRDVYLRELRSPTSGIQGK